MASLYKPTSIGRRIAGAFVMIFLGGASPPLAEGRPWNPVQVVGAIGRASEAAVYSDPDSKARLSPMADCGVLSSKLPRDGLCLLALLPLG